MAEHSSSARREAIKRDPWSVVGTPSISPRSTATTSQSSRGDKTLAFSNIVLLIFSVSKMYGDVYAFFSSPLLAALGLSHDDIDCRARGLPLWRIRRGKPDRRRQSARPVRADRSLGDPDGLRAAARRGRDQRRRRLAGPAVEGDPL